MFAWTKVQNIITRLDQTLLHLFRPSSLPHPNPKYFLFHPSHQIFRRMHGVLNVGKKDN
jgi:hypothetical protein